MKRVLTIVTAALALVAAPVWMHAAEIEQRPAIISFAGGAWTQTPGPTAGWAFSVHQPIQVTQLGFVDRNGDGLDAEHPVGLWRATGTLTGDLLATVTIDTFDPLIGIARYEALSSPIALTPGEIYVVGAYVPPGSAGDWITSPSSVQRDPVINYLGARFGSAAGALSYPFGSNPTNSGRYGPNLMLAVPEPGTAALLIPIAAAVLRCRRRRHGA